MNYLDMDEESFLKLSDKFKSPHLWKRENNKWELRYNIE